MYTVKWDNFETVYLFDYENNYVKEYFTLQLQKFFNTKLCYTVAVDNILIALPVYDTNMKKIMNENLPDMN